MALQSSLADTRATPQFHRRQITQSSHRIHPSRLSASLISHSRTEPNPTQLAEPFGTRPSAVDASPLDSKLPRPVQPSFISVRASPTRPTSHHGSTHFNRDRVNHRLCHESRRQRIAVPRNSICPVKPAEIGWFCAESLVLCLSKVGRWVVWGGKWILQEADTYQAF